jgi:aryl-alcohol dehydrogenase-like predicted oxidoreductase
MGMSEFYGERNDDESIKTLQHAVDIGVRFWDTADMYGPYINEILVGRALKGIRNNIMLATKFGITRNPETGERGLNGKPEYVKKACEASLKRLDVEVIDLYYLHRVDPNTPVEETVGAMAELVKAGKIRGIGLSEVSAATLKRVHTSVHPISAVQSEYSLWTRDPEDGVLQACRDLGVAFVAYSPLGRGFLTGQIKKFEDFTPDDYRRFSPRFQGDNFQKNLEIVHEIHVLAEKKACTPSQLALAWVMAKGEFIFPIPGTKRIKYLDENVGALKLTFTEKELREIDVIFPKGIAAGLRYPEQMMGSLNG